jgi:hypothetical protein
MVDALKRLEYRGYDSIKIITEVGVENIRGIVMDFRRVERFDKGNMATVQRESYNIKNRFDLSRIPVALVVDTPLQEQIVDFTAKVTPDRHLKQLVYSVAEAHTYFDEWHHQQSASV